MQKPAHKILKPLKLKGSVSERNHAGTTKRDETSATYDSLKKHLLFFLYFYNKCLPVKGEKMRGPNMLAKELIPDIHP
jgi:hypothetical protein